MAVQSQEAIYWRPSRRIRRVIPQVQVVAETDFGHSQCFSNAGEKGAHPEISHGQIAYTCNVCPT